MNEQMSDGEVASVGSLGTSIRGDRVYHNATQFHDRSAGVYEIVEDITSRLDDIQTPEATQIQPGSGVSRAVFRGIVSRQVLGELLDSSLATNIEAGVNLHDYGDEGWLIYLGFNLPGRNALVPAQQILEETNSYQYPSSFLPSELPEDIRYGNTIPAETSSQLHTLWLPFGWEADGIEVRATSIQQNLDRRPSKREVWFGGAWHDKTLVSAATAERITYHGATREVDCVESTEWSTDPRYRQLGRSTIAHVLWRMNQQIVADLSAPDGALPIIFAEANFTTRADKAARRAGFTIPDRRYIPQIIVQNVTVEDGVGPSNSWRDFTYVVLPPSASEIRAQQ